MVLLIDTGMDQDYDKRAFSKRVAFIITCFTVTCFCCGRVWSRVDHLMEDLPRMKFLFCLLGLVLFVEGLPYVISPNKMKKWMSTLQEIPDSNLRTMGLLAMALGLLISYFFKE